MSKMMRAWHIVLSSLYQLATRYPFYRLEHTPSKNIASLLQLFAPYHFTSIDGQAVALTRVGSVFDGGYLIPEDYAACDALISGGISFNYDFEEAIVKKMPVFSYDKTVPAIPVSGITHHALHLNSYSHPDNYINYPDILLAHKLVDKKKLMLKIDIEGAEYDFLQGVQPAHLENIAVLIVEFHMINLCKGSLFYAQFMNLLEKIKLSHFVVHTHLNNVGSYEVIGGHKVPRIAEVTFVNKRYYAPTHKRELWSHPLDNVDIPNRPRLYYNGQLH